MFKNILSYFDLNKDFKKNALPKINPPLIYGRSPTTGARMKFTEKSRNIPSGKGSATAMPFYEQIFLYVSSVVGVLFSSIFNQSDPMTFSLNKININSIIISMVIALVIIPFGYQKLNIKPDTPLII